MSEYLRPDVYIERPATANRSIASVGTSVGAIVGACKSGYDDRAILCTNWTEFLNNFAKGLASPFDANHLATSVYGFFQNGGSKLYVARVVGTGAAAATITTGGVTATAKFKGAWGNSLICDIVGTTTFTANIYLGTKVAANLVESFEGITTAAEITSEYLTVTGTLAEATLTLATGSDGSAPVTKDYTDALARFDGKPINMLAIPGIAASDALTAVKAYIEGRGGDVFYIADTASGVAPASLMTAVTPATKYAAVYYPWIKILDPTAISTALRISPPSGHVMGMYARTDYLRGTHKAPAGEEAILNGVYALERELTPGNVELLNPLRYNCILSKPNVGFCVWGARTLSSDSNFRYVSDARYDIKVEQSVKAGTQWAVFEPIADDLFAKLRDTIWNYLYTEWASEKALMGLTPDEAFYVKCDRELNTEQTIEQGKLIAEFGYARKKPAEFVIIRITQMPSIVSVAAATAQ